MSAVIGIYKKCSFYIQSTFKGFLLTPCGENVGQAHGCVCVWWWRHARCQAEEERDGMEKVKLDNRRILFNLLPAHVAQHFLLSNPRNMVSVRKKNKQQDCGYQTVMGVKGDGR